MKTTRRRHGSEFKARIALEALKGLKTVQEIAAENDLHPGQVTTWKTQMLEGASSVFDNGKAVDQEPQGPGGREGALGTQGGPARRGGRLAAKKVQGVGDRSMRKVMVEKEGNPLSIRRQCALLGIARNRLQSHPPRRSKEDLAVARRMDEVALEFPEYGSRRHMRTLQREGHRVGQEKVRGLMRLMGLQAIYRRPRTSQPGKGHKIYPYLLRGREVREPDKAWCAEITYIPMAKGFAYLVAVMDWKSRVVLSWTLSNTLESGFCVAALKEAAAQVCRVVRNSLYRGLAFINRKTRDHLVLLGTDPFDGH